MFTFKIEGKRYSPEILIDGKSQRIEIKGSSMLDDASWFYSSVLKWVVAFNKYEDSATTFNIRLDQVNKSSRKWIMLIVRKLSVILPNHQVIVNWYYQSNDKAMQLNGERLKLESMLPVNIIAA